MALDRLTAAAELLDRSLSGQTMNVDFDKYMATRDSSEHPHVKSAAQYTQEVIDRFYGDNELKGLTMPWARTHDKIRIRPNEVSIWAGFNGHGKSMVLGQVMAHLMGQGEKVGIASFEMKPAATLARMCRQACGSNSPAIDYIHKFQTWADTRCWVYDQQGTVKSDRVIAVMYYAAEKLGITQFVIDSLMKCGINEDDYNAQKRFVDQLCTVARDTGMHIHLVAHSRKGEDEESPPNKMAIRGSGTLTDQVDNVYTCWRNKKKERQVESGKATPDVLQTFDAMIICDKARHGEWEGRIPLWFDKQSFRYKNSSQEKVWEMNLGISQAREEQEVVQPSLPENSQLQPITSEDSW